ncbi:uncharacterized protein PAC_06224 [Phialocephala subalpina]|uniref:Zn(2)-C6 fungal-type domain-containing protein n=1 Tax=Phialocephala subalpina TaxID=576137 RepID=A0A1L7WU92_9HELO|nr:uncharacterized protein PAC_06224 [Phialocephala subalpina]
MTTQNASKKVSENRKRASAPKTRSGCLTCRKRRVKCDEQRPQCDRCIKSSFSCDGYQTPKLRRKIQEISSLPKLAPRLFVSPESDTKSKSIPIPTLHQWNTSGGLLLLQPRNTLFRTDQEARYFRLFCDKVTIQLTGFFDLPLWNRLILQTAEQEESVRLGIISIGALQQTIDLRNSQDSRYIAPFAALDEHHRFAVQEYSKAIKQMRVAISTQKHNLRTTLLTCLLIICFESLHGNHESAIAQMQVGIRLLEDFIASRRESLSVLDTTSSIDSAVAESPSFALHSPAPDIIEDDLVQAFARLDMQANSFIDSRPIDYHLEMRYHGADCISRMPASFSSIPEARRYYELVTRRLMHWISSVFHRRTCENGQSQGSQLLSQISPRNQHQAPDSECGGILNRENPIHPPSSSTYAEQQFHLDELERWRCSFTPLLNSYRDQTQSKEYLAVTSLQVRFMSSRFALSANLSTDQLIYDDRIEEVREITRLAKILHLHPSTKGEFAFDLGYIPQLYVIAIKCRDRSLRREAIQLLRSRSWREGVWDSKLAASMAVALMEIEEEGLHGDFLPNEARVRGTKMKFDLQKREGHLTCFMAGGEVKERTIRW